MTTKPDRRTAHWHRKAAAERAKGKVRRYLWAYPDDWPEIQATAERLTDWRERLNEAKARKEKPARDR